MTNDPKPSKTEQPPTTPVENSSTSTSMPLACDLLVEFGEAYSLVLENRSLSEACDDLRRTSRAILTRITGSVEVEDLVDVLIPWEDRIQKFEELTVSQEPCPPHLEEPQVALALLIQFGLSYTFASHMQRHDTNGHLVSSTQALLYLLTGQDALPEHVEDVAPHAEALCDA